jgi:ppGpp synthetase/RelA/SpoT-type nucleotidyltranferase
MAERKVEDRLREEYFDLLPEIRSVTENLEAEIKYRVLPILRGLHRFEQIVVKSRIKECERAVDSLRRRQEGLIFDPELVEKYTLTELNDLAGIRVLVFPRSRRIELNQTLRERFPLWDCDPFRGDPHETLGYKYTGLFQEASTRVRGEYQIVSMLVGLFWEVEHSAIYKPTPELRSATRSLPMQERTQDVLRSLAAFEAEFEKISSEETR